MRVLAFGDVHGCYDRLLKVLGAAGVVDPEGHWTAGDALLIGLGDYIDRGPDSNRVIDLLMRLRGEAEAQGGQAVSLRGNHEQAMLDAAAGNKGDLEFWELLGGQATLQSYGTTLEEYAATPQQVIPEAHLRFLNSLPYTHRAAESLFVHGGVDLSRPLEEQDPSVLMEIRRWWVGQPEWVEQRCGARRVVFGHTPHKDVTSYLDGRAIAVDTGAVYGGKLSLIEVDNDGWKLAAQA